MDIPSIDEVGELLNRQFSQLLSMMSVTPKRLTAWDFIPMRTGYSVFHPGY
jgi:hypothetical protein